MGEKAGRRLDSGYQLSETEVTSSSAPRRGTGAPTVHKAVWCSVGRTGREDVAGSQDKEAESPVAWVDQL